MRISAAILVSMLAACFTAAAAPRIAVVRVADIYKQLESTRQQQQELQAKREAVFKDRRAEELNKLVADLNSRREQFASLDPENRAKAEREYTVKRQEAQTLREDFSSFQAAKHREINAELVSGMQASLEKIRAFALKIGREQGFDWVLDTSGNTNTGLPLILYAKNAVDLTDQVAASLGVAALNK